MARYAHFERGAGPKSMCAKQLELAETFRKIRLAEKFCAHSGSYTQDIATLSVIPARAAGDTQATYRAGELISSSQKPKVPFD